MARREVGSCLRAASPSQRVSSYRHSHAATRAAMSALHPACPLAPHTWRTARATPACQLPVVPLLVALPSSLPSLWLNQGPATPVFPSVFSFFLSFSAAYGVPLFDFVLLSLSSRLLQQGRRCVRAVLSPVLSTQPECPLSKTSQPTPALTVSQILAAHQQISYSFSPFPASRHLNATQGVTPTY